MTDEREESRVRARARVIESLCDHLAGGRHADQWYGVDDNPSYQTIWRWRREDKATDDAIEEARRTGSHVLVDQAVGIADGTSPLAQGPETYPGQRKTQCWARFEAAKRIHPQRYGDKVQVGGDGGEPIKLTVDKDAAVQELASILATAAARKE